MRKKSKPPSIAIWLASKFIDEKLLEEFLGDLEEIYHERRSSRGGVYASMLYWFDVLHLITGFPSRKRSSGSNHLVMYHHYITTTFRNLGRTKVYSFVNIISLAVGMGVCLAICQYIYFELSYDRFHGNYQNIYRVAVNGLKASGDKYPYPYETGYALGVAAKDEFEEIDQSVRLHKYSGGAVVNTSEQSKIFTEEAADILFTDKSFFEVFSFPFKLGGGALAFHDKYSVVLTESAAFKYFGDTDPLGKTLTFSGGVSPGDYVVTGVVDLPPNSHLQFDFLLPFENYVEFGWGGAATKNDNGWESPDCATYLKLDASSNVDLVTNKIDQLIRRHNGERNRQEGIIENVELQPIADIHLRSAQSVDPGLSRNNGNIANIQFFSIIAFILLVIPWINYINLSTARSIHRAKEVGIRKAIGAFRRQLITQFITESIVVNLLASAFSIGIAILISPVLNNIVGHELELTLLKTSVFWLALLAVSLVGAVLSGLYPALILSSFKTISILGGNKTAKSGSFTLRRGLITFQFLASLLLISGTYLVYSQITFMRSQNLGMNLEKVLVVRGPEVNLDRSTIESTLQSFAKNVTQHHSIISVAASSSVPGKGYNTGLAIRKLGQPESASQFGRVVFAGAGLPEAYDLQFLAGTSPTTDVVSQEVVVVINEEAVRSFGLGSPEKAIQEKLYYKEDTFRIAGVVKDFHWHSLKEAHTPYVFEFYPDCRSYLSFKINTSDLDGSLRQIESTYNSFFPGNAFDFFFLEDEFNQQYQADVQFGKLFFGFTVLAMFISCIGLFALVSYSAALRTKEIGIRKILDASVSGIMLELSREYVILLLIANAFAIPAIIFWGNAWLNDYAFRISLGIGLFVLPILLLFIISFLTTGYRTYLAARINPVESLRSE